MYLEAANKSWQAVYFSSASVVVLAPRRHKVAPSAHKQHCIVAYHHKISNLHAIAVEQPARGGSEPQPLLCSAQ